MCFCTFQVTRNCWLVHPFLMARFCFACVSGPAISAEYSFLHQGREWTVFVPSFACTHTLIFSSNRCFGDKLGSQNFSNEGDSFTWSLSSLMKEIFSPYNQNDFFWKKNRLRLNRYALVHILLKCAFLFQKHFPWPLLFQVFLLFTKENSSSHMQFSFSSL